MLAGTVHWKMFAQSAPGQLVRTPAGPSPKPGSLSLTKYAAARVEGNFDIAAVIAGESAGLVREILPARDIVARMVRDAATLDEIWLPEMSKWWRPDLGE